MITRAASLRGGSASAVYEGVVRHRRVAPHPHVFYQRIAQLFIDLDELDTVFSRHWLWSKDRPNIAEFRRRDYLGPGDVPLAEAVRQLVQRESGHRPQGPVRILTHLRYFGYVFNPVTFYYCYAANGEALEAIVAEITNTPWKERHAYVLTAATAQRQGRVLAWSFAKAFHVSPFMPMNRDYAWRFNRPDKHLYVHMNVLRDGQHEFDAHVSLTRRPLDSRALAAVLCRYPLMTVQVVGAIHWHAFRLWVKRNPIYDHPKELRGS